MTHSTLLTKISTFFLTTPNKWWVVIAMAISMGMTIIDQTSVTIALPIIQKDLKISPQFAQWILNVYFMMLGIFLIIGGRLGDLYQHRRVFIVGLIIFTFFSLVCAIAPNFEWLIFGRIFQGFGAALIMSNTGVIIIQHFGADEKGKAMGIYMAISLLFLPFALLIGGMFTQFLSWRMIFAINLPLAVLCFFITNSYVKKVSTQIAVNLDWIGLITLATAVFSLNFALMESHELSQAIIILLLFASIINFLLCYILEKNIDYPLIDFQIFKNKLFLCALLLIFCQSSLNALFVFTSYFYQNVLGYSPTIAGLLFLPEMICIILFAPFAGKLFDKYGYPLPVLGGLCLIILGLFINSRMVFFQSYWVLLPGILCTYIGLTFNQSPLYTATISSFQINVQGVASGILNAMRQTGSGITLALLTTIIYYKKHGLHITKEAYTASYSLVLLVCMLLFFFGLLFTIATIIARGRSNLKS